MAAKIVDLARQVVFDCSQHAPVEKFRRACAIEMAVEIGSVIENFDIALSSRPPFNEGHEWRGVSLQR